MLNCLAEVIYSRCIFVVLHTTLQMFILSEHNLQFMWLERGYMSMTQITIQLVQGHFVQNCEQSIMSLHWLKFPSPSLCASTWIKSHLAIDDVLGLCFITRLHLVFPSKSLTIHVYDDNFFRKSICLGDLFYHDRLIWSACVIDVPNITLILK